MYDFNRREASPSASCKTSQVEPSGSLSGGGLPTPAEEVGCPQHTVQVSMATPSEYQFFHSLSSIVSAPPRLQPNMNKHGLPWPRLALSFGALIPSAGVLGSGCSHNGQPLVFLVRILSHPRQGCCRSPSSSNQAMEMAQGRRQGKTLRRNQRLSGSPDSLPSGRKTSATSHRCLEELAFQYP
uniref:Uncharacterized protein n=1 Tax=Photinus pyralis TaxID=7054 RepID=A0A1Y1K1M2_PHOPY